MSRASKRTRRGDRVITTRTVRPIEKKLVSISKDNMAGTQVSTDLLTTTFPGTITGLRWDLEYHQDGGTGPAIFYWALVIERDGVTVDNIGFSDAASFFNPEQNCLAFGCGSIDNNVQSFHVSGTTKTMRKMQDGDKLVFISVGVATNTCAVRGVIQFFLKS